MRVLLRALCWAYGCASWIRFGLMDASLEDASDRLPDTTSNCEPARPSAREGPVAETLFKSVGHPSQNMTTFWACHADGGASGITAREIAADMVEGSVYLLGNASDTSLHGTKCGH